jgi:FkbM family methyltransferase
MKGLVFDIGANIGQSAKHFLDAGASKIICVEPVLEAFNQIPVDSRIVKVHAAAWRRTCILDVYPAKGELGWSTLKPEKWGRTKPSAVWCQPIPVVCITLDVLSAEYGIPDMVKIDVEGSEHAVIQGMSFRPRKVIFEFCNVFMEDAFSCLLLLQSKGFRNASYTDPNLDAQLEPADEIDDCITNLKRYNPRSGNIIVT